MPEMLVSLFLSMCQNTNLIPVPECVESLKTCYETSYGDYGDETLGVCAEQYMVSRAGGRSDIR